MGSLTILDGDFPCRPIEKMWKVWCEKGMWKIYSKFLNKTPPEIKILDGDKRLLVKAFGEAEK